MESERAASRSEEQKAENELQFLIAATSPQDARSLASYSTYTMYCFWLAEWEIWIETVVVNGALVAWVLLATFISLFSNIDRARSTKPYTSPAFSI